MNANMEEELEEVKRGKKNMLGLILLEVGEEKYFRSGHRHF